MKKLLLLIHVIVMLLTVSAFAQSNFRTYALTNDKYAQLFPASAVSYNGGDTDGTLLCWLDERQGGSLYAQKFIADGSTAWTGSGIVVDTGLGNTLHMPDDYPHCYSDGHGGIMFIYRKKTFGREDIYSAMLDGAGFRKYTPVNLSPGSGLNFRPRSVQTSDGSIVVVWENFSRGDFNIHGQRIARGLVKEWGKNPVQITRDPQDQRRPELAVSEFSSVTVAWQETVDPNIPSSDIYAKILNLHDGTTPAGEDAVRVFSRIIRQPGVHNQNGNAEKLTEYSHRLIASGSSFVFVFDDADMSGNGFARMKRFSGKLEEIWDMKVEETGAASNTMIIPSMPGSFITFWNNGIESIGDIRGAAFSETGPINNKRLLGFRISCDNQKFQTMRSFGNSNNPAAFDKTGNKLVIAWVNDPGGKLYINEYCLTDGSGACKRVQLISEGSVSAEQTSVTTQAGSFAVVYNHSQDIYISIRDMFQEDRKVIEPEARIANFPNPFNPTTSINFYVPKDGFVRLSIYDILGRQLSVPVNGYLRRGNHKVSFDGAGYSSGTYVYALETNGKRHIGRMTMLK